MPNPEINNTQGWCPWFTSLFGYLQNNSDKKTQQVAKKTLTANGSMFSDKWGRRMYKEIRKGAPKDDQYTFQGYLKPTDTENCPRLTSKEAWEDQWRTIKRSKFLILGYLVGWTLLYIGCRQIDRARALQTASCSTWPSLVKIE